LSEKLHTPPLPVTHVLLGYCWSYSRFAHSPVPRARPNNDTPSLRSYHVTTPLPEGAGITYSNSALSAEMKPLTGRDLTVIRPMQCDDR